MIHQKPYTQMNKNEILGQKKFFSHQTMKIIGTICVVSIKIDGICPTKILPKVFPPLLSMTINKNKNIQDCVAKLIPDFL